MNPNDTTVRLIEETDPTIWAEAKARREKFDQNIAWLEAHASDVYSNRGKFYCISGGEAFIADTVEEAVALARAAHPEDDGRFTGYVPKDKLPRIYANRW
jgi:hypothetical protein